MQLTTLLLFLTSVLMTSGQTPGPDQVCLLVPPDVEECYRSFHNKPISTTATQVFCLQKLLWHYNPYKDVSTEDLTRINNMVTSFRNPRRSRGRNDTIDTGVLFPNTGFRYRSEYRTLTYDERMRFNNAINTLYRDGIIGAFARLHAQAFTPHHRGPSFLPWHRVMLTVFEEFLRRVDPTVSLPYLDTTMDFDMDNPTSSMIWSPEYLGNGIGAVSTGPFAGWVTDQGYLERNYGQGGRLFTKPDINTVLTNCRLEEISRPYATPENDFEVFHGGVHVWIGGDMGTGESAAWDPVFYMHHAYVDYIWEVFRIRQRDRCRVDPTRDYPTDIRNASHALDAPMLGFRGITNGDGIADYWTQEFYDYNPTPVCPNCCPRCSRPVPIRCDRRRGVCVARSRRRLPPNIANMTLSTPLGRSAALSLNDQFFDDYELEAMRNPMIPRNRGRRFMSPPDDPRKLETALFDTIENANREANDRSSPSTRTSRPSGSPDVRTDSSAMNTRGASSSGNVPSGTRRSSGRSRGTPFDSPPPRTTANRMRSQGGRSWV